MTKAKLTNEEIAEFIYTLTDNQHENYKSVVKSTNDFLHKYGSSKSIIDVYDTRKYRTINCIKNILGIKNSIAGKARFRNLTAEEKKAVSKRAIKARAEKRKAKATSKMIIEEIK